MMKKKLTALALSAAACLSLLSGCGNGGSEAVTIRVGASPAPHAEILEVAKEVLAEQGINLEIVEFTDYIMPNNAVENGEIDANYFQHITYMDNFNKEHSTHLTSVASIHYEPFGIYAGRVSTLADLPDGATIGIPNDATNGGRALLLLAEQGLITLPEEAGLEPTVMDIVDNPHNFNIEELEDAQLLRSLSSLDVAVINGNYAIDAGLSVDDALALESSGGAAATAYANILAVKEGNEDSQAVQALVEALQSEQVKQFMAEQYGAAVVPLF